ncbi:methyl-accepting chemotaxis protein [Paraneptunicella aestuarii]|nr:methyl-accepting chemotaxis protein [Paraneptunicella aestuarii]
MTSWVMTLSVKGRLLLGFSITLALMILLTIVGVEKVNFIDKALTEITDINSLKQRYAINYRGSVHDRAIAIRDVAIARTESELASFETEIDRLAQFYRESERNMDNMLSSDIDFSSEEKKILNHISAIQSKTLPLIETIIERKKQNQDVQSLVLDQARPAFIEWLDTINEFIDYQGVQNKNLTAETRNETGGFSQLMLFITLGAIAISVLVGFIIERSFRLSLGGEPNDAAKTISRIAKGDLSIETKTEYQDSMLGSINSMTRELTGIVRSIQDAAQQLSTQSGNLSASSNEIYESARHQAKATEDTSVKLENLRDNITKVSEIARLTEDNSKQTVDFSERGRKAIKATAEAMEQILETVNNTVRQIQKLAEQTTQIGGIANVISGISEQTNLLALNAAIEAARAGESGRGFAVVADEVRQLAQRTGEATNQIESMIKEVQGEASATVSAMEKTQPQVEHGRALTLEANELLQQIDSQAQSTLDQVAEVVTVAKQQVNAINEVAIHMDDIAASSKDAISALQENRASTKTLNDLSDRLKVNIQFFKLSH